MNQNPVSPKVTSGATWATVATLGLAFINSVTPDMLAPLGKWAPLVSGLLTIVSFGIGAYLKEDPLRQPGKVADATGVINAIAERLKPQPSDGGKHVAD